MDHGSVGHEFSCGFERQWDTIPHDPIYSLSPYHDDNFLHPREGHKRTVQETEAPLSSPDQTLLPDQSCVDQLSPVFTEIFNTSHATYQPASRLPPSSLSPKNQGSKELMTTDPPP